MRMSWLIFCFILLRFWVMGVDFGTVIMVLDWGVFEWS